MFESVAPFFKLGHLFLEIWFFVCLFSSLYSLDINPLTNVYIAGHNSLPLCEFLLHSVDYSFVVRQLLSVRRSHLSITDLNS